MLYTTYEPYIGSGNDDDCDLFQFVDEEHKRWCVAQNMDVDEKDFEDE